MNIFGIQKKYFNLNIIISRYKQNSIFDQNIWFLQKIFCIRSRKMSKTLIGWISKIEMPAI